MSVILSLLTGWTLDLLIGDPSWLPHPIVWFGKAISTFEHHLNKGLYRKVKGAFTAIILITAVFIITWVLRHLCTTFNYQLSIINCQLSTIFDAIIIFYCLAGTTLIREVQQVFLALDRSLDEGRRQVARIVGRDTQELSAQEVRTAALETLAENLSDGVIAPLFWFAILGTPGMLAYKMVNTLDSMIGYKTDRYRDFGCWAARIDDIANYIPARLTALLMILPRVVSFNLHGNSKFFTFNFTLFTFVCTYGRRHASPNSGYPEAALAALLNCRFGGPHYYFGQVFDKPYIGENDRLLTTEDMKKAVRVNRTAEVLMILLITIIYLSLYFNI